MGDCLLVAGIGLSFKYANQSRKMSCQTWHSCSMRISVLAVTIFILVPMGVGAQQRETYSWVDDDGIKHYGDRIPPEFADKPKDVINEQGVKVGELEGKKSAEEIEAERVAAQRRQAEELRRRQNMALLATYISVNEIEMHRDRRVELFQAQARVTELYLRNLRRRLDQLKGVAGRYKPYNSDPAAQIVDPSLVEEITDTETAITRHQSNLKKYQSEEQKIKERFERDIDRFKSLKGLTVSQVQAVPE